MAIMISNHPKEQIDFAIDWFQSAIERDKDHNQDLCLDCQANQIALQALKHVLYDQKMELLKAYRERTL